MTKKILWISRMEPNKRPRDALAVIKKIKEKLGDAELYMIGEGTLLAEAKEAGRQIEGSHFLGSVSDKRKEQLLKGCDVLISTSEFEGFGLTIGEAFLKGKPVVTYRIPSIVSVYGDAVVYAKVGDINDFSDKLYKVLTDDAYRKRKASQGREKVLREYSTETVAGKIESALREILKQ
ncbi:MAG: glycosyltransferase family 4 protein [Promethearchaeati archaeon SRVP18_Atabeyarchaeia-1]